MSSLTFEDYAIIREWLLGVMAATEQPLSSVERSLYELSRLVPPGEGRTWAAYADAVAEQLATLS